MDTDLSVSNLSRSTFEYRFPNCIFYNGLKQCNFVRGMQMSFEHSRDNARKKIKLGTPRRIQKYFERLLWKCIFLAVSSSYWHNYIRRINTMTGEKYDLRPKKKKDIKNTRRFRWRRYGQKFSETQQYIYWQSPIFTSKDWVIVFWTQRHKVEGIFLWKINSCALESEKNKHISGFVKTWNNLKLIIFAIAD